MTDYYIDLRKDTHNCPFASFLPLGRISCEGAGYCHFLTTVVNFGFRTFWADLTLLCVKKCRFFWAEIPGKTQHDLNMKTWSGICFLEMVIFVLKGANLQKMDRNQTTICPGKKFATNEYPGYIYIYICMCVFVSDVHVTWCNPDVRKHQPSMSFI